MSALAVKFPKIRATKVIRNRWEPLSFETIRHGTPTNILVKLILFAVDWNLGSWGAIFAADSMDDGWGSIFSEVSTAYDLYL